MARDLKKKATSVTVEPCRKFHLSRCAIHCKFFFFFNTLTALFVKAEGVTPSAS